MNMILNVIHWVRKTNKLQIYKVSIHSKFSFAYIYIQSYIYNISPLPRSIPAHEMFSMYANKFHFITSFACAICAVFCIFNTLFHQIYQSSQPTCIQYVLKVNLPIYIDLLYAHTARKYRVYELLFQSYSAVKLENQIEF